MSISSMCNHGKCICLLRKTHEVAVLGSVNGQRSTHIYMARIVHRVGQIEHIYNDNAAFTGKFDVTTIELSAGRLRPPTERHQQYPNEK